MQMYFDTNRSRWEAQTRYGEPAADLVKASGFKWDPNAKRWHSADALAAMKLRDYADAATQARLETAVAAAKVEHESKAKAAEEAITASRAKDSDIEIPIAAGREFLPYQKAGIAYALKRSNVLFADDMGLGKTAQAIGVVNADTSLRKILVICPASLTRNWVREFGFFGSRDLTIGIATTKKVPITDIVVCNYDIFSRQNNTSGVLKGIEWDCLILDEAHYLKNSSAQRTHAIIGIAGIRVSKRRLYLTGTPVTNRPIDLWPLLNSLMPVQFDHKMAYAQRYCNAYHNGYGWDFSGASNLDELQSKLRAFIMVRRLKSDVLTELPSKRRQIIELPANTPELRAVLRLEAEAESRTESEVAKHRAIVNKVSSDPEAHKAAVEALKAAQQVAFTEMSRVRHQTAIAKAPVVAQHVIDATEAGGKIIVFAHHADVIEHLCTALANLGVVSITGETNIAKRQAIVDQFQNDDKIRVFVGNIQAAGVGITLTASSHVIFAELDWVPANMSQAEDRAHRLGQRDSVLVQHLVLEGSLDAKMAKTLTDKQHVIDASMDKEEDAADRDARLAKDQAAKDAEAAAVLADVKAREAQEAAAAAAREAWRAEDRAAVEALRAADAVAEKAARLAKLLASVDAAASEAGTDALPSPEATTAIHASLRLLTAYDADRATESNGIGFSKTDSYHGHYLSGLDALSDAEAIVGRLLVRRYQRQLVQVDPDLVECALGERVVRRDVAAATKPVVPNAVVQPVVEASVAEMTEPPAAPVEEIPGFPLPSMISFLASLDFPANDDLEPLVTKMPVKRGRPTKAASGGVALSQVERNRKYREARAITAVDVPGGVAERLREMRDARRLTTEELLKTALDALEVAEERALSGKHDIAYIAPISMTEANAALVRWGHKMGPCNRPNKRIFAHGLFNRGELVAVLISSAIVAATCAGLDRKQAVELARLCAVRPGLCRVALRMWREFVFPLLREKYGYEWAVSYQDEALHSGDTYRFDGWVRLREHARSGPDTRTGRKGRTKTIWGWHEDKAAREELAIAA